MKMKRLAALLIMLCMIVCILPPTYTNAAIIATGTCGPNLSVTLDDEYTLTISGTGSMYDGILEPTPAQTGDIKEVVIQPGVQAIGAGAFAFYTNMAEISIPDTVTFIGSSALAMCGSLKTVRYNNTFASWKAKTEFAETFDRGYTLHCTDGTYQMCGFTAQWKLDEQGKLTVFGEGKMMDRDDWSFIHSPWDGVEGIREAVIADGITHVGSGMFFVCNELETVWISDSVTSIGDTAFHSCENLTKIRIPATVAAIGEDAFWNNRKLADVEYTGSFDTWKSQDFHYNAFESAFNLHCTDGTYQMCGTDATWSLDTAGNLHITGEGVIKGADWLGKADQIKKVVIPASITGIGSYAFQNCTALTSVQMHDGLTLLDWGAFSGCTGLTSVQIPNSITTIVDDAFGNCTNLVSVQIPDSVTEIGAHAFIHCSSLASITLPDGITVLNDGVFSDCTSLKDIHLPANLERISSRTFESCTSLEEITLPAGLQTIGQLAFNKCTDLQAITIPRSVNEMGGGAFEFCKKLQKIQYEGSLADWMAASMQQPVFDSVFEINCTDGTYQMCGGKATWTLDETGHLEISGTGAADGYDWAGRAWDIRTATIHEGITRIADGCFSDCRNLQSVNIPKGVTFIGSSAFENCKSLAVVTLPEGLQEIYGTAFNGCGNLQTAFIPDTVTEIGWYAFSGCNQLTDIYYDGTQAQWEAINIGNYNAPLASATIHYKHIHTWQAATCTAPKTCTVCGAMEGSALGHKWQIINCDSAKNCVRCHAVSDGPAGHTYDDGVDGTCNICGIHREDTEDRTVMHMFRMYDPNSGEHFYTGSTVERDNLVAAGWNYEGVGFTFSLTTGAPVYRLYDRYDTFEHLYTMDVEERDRLVADGWELEGIAFNSAYDTEVPQYRLHNPNETRGAYHFTASEEERDALIAAGWEYQGIGFYSSWK